MDKVPSLQPCICSFAVEEAFVCLSYSTPSSFSPGIFLLLAHLSSRCLETLPSRKTSPVGIERKKEHLAKESRIIKPTGSIHVVEKF